MNKYNFQVRDEKIAWQKMKLLIFKCHLLLQMASESIMYVGKCNDRSNY